MYIDISDIVSDEVKIINVYIDISDIVSDEVK